MRTNSLHLSPDRRGALLAALPLLTALVAGSGCDETPDPDAACRDLKPGHACTWLGIKGEEGFNGDGHHRAESVVNQPQDLLFLPDGTAWFTDFNNFLIRRVNADDTLETMVGSTDPLFPGDGPWGGITPGAAGSEWLLNHPTNLVLRPDGDVLVVAWHNHKLLMSPANDRLRLRRSAAVARASRATAWTRRPGLALQAGQRRDLRRVGQHLRRRSAATSGVRQIDTDGDHHQHRRHRHGSATAATAGRRSMAQFSWARRVEPQPERRHRLPRRQALHLRHREAT
jgi:hypothetical protein